MSGTWNSQAWLEKWLPVWDSRDRMWQHTVRAEYYRGHMQLVRSGEYITESGKSVRIPCESCEQTENAHTKGYSVELHPAPPEKVYDTLIETACEDCLITARRLMAEGKTAVLNLANRSTPGGGALSGSGAQEESIFMRSNYFLHLYPWNSYIANRTGLPAAGDLYPMDRDFGGAYTRDVTIFRGRELEGYPLLEEPWQMNFIAVAAMNRPPCDLMPWGEYRYSGLLAQAAMNKIRTVLNIAADNGIENLVLGALGCGAFRNPPRQTAELFRRALNEPAHKGRFRRVVFAITGEELCETFRQVLVEGK